MANSKHEDALLKMGVEYFREHILKMIGIDYTYEEAAPTELVAITINELYMDFTFKTTEDMYIHVEFQTTNHSEDADLRRFHSYEALFSHNTGKKVITYVIYTGGIRHTRGELDCGAYTYRVIPVYTGEKNGDEILEKLQKKKDAGETLSEEDMAHLALTPLMGGSLSRKEKIKRGILLAKDYQGETSGKVTAMLYALADKFLDGKDMEEIKEAIIMTRLGQMLVDDGIKIGMERGMELGKEQLKQLKQLMNRLLAAGRIEDCMRVTQDEEYCKKLMEEFGIK